MSTPTIDINAGVVFGASWPVRRWRYRSSRASGRMPNTDGISGAETAAAAIPAADGVQATPYGTPRVISACGSVASSCQRPRPGCGRGR
ncbi:MAG: hypothetical protein AAGA93_14475 [Actinomycetota bacterium]